MAIPGTFREQMDAMSRLVQKLAPGRKVRRISLDFSVRSIAVATVEVLVEQDDMPLIEELCPDSATIVEVKE